MRMRFMVSSCSAWNRYCSHRLWTRTLFVVGREADLHGPSGKPPLRVAVRKPGCATAIRAQHGNRFIGVDAIGTAAVGDVLAVGGQLGDAGAKVGDRHGAGPGNVSTGVFLF